MKGRAFKLIKKPHPVPSVLIRDERRVSSETDQETQRSVKEEQPPPRRP